MAAITQTGEELLLPNLSLGRKAAQVGLGCFGVKSIAAQNQKGLAQPPIPSPGMDPHTAGGGFDTSTLMHRRQESNTSNRIRSERHRGPPSEKALRRPIEPRVRHAAHVSRLRSGHEAREQKRNKPWPTEPHRTNQTYRCRAQDATARAQQHSSELWSPVRDEEAAGSNPVTPTSATGLWPARMPHSARGVPFPRNRERRFEGTKRNTRESQGKHRQLRQGEETPGLPARRSRPRGIAG